MRILKGFTNATKYCKIKGTKKIRNEAISKEKQHEKNRLQRTKKETTKY